MNNPFLEDGESTHEYNGQIFIVDYYTESNTWQCSDAYHWVRARSITKEQAINEAHKNWDNYCKSNNIIK
jgi:hypothetical protein